MATIAGGVSMKRRDLIRQKKARKNRRFPLYPVCEVCVCCHGRIVSGICRRSVKPEW